MSENDKIPQYMHYLKKDKNFRELTEDETNLLMNNMRIKNIPKGQIIFDEMDPRSRLYYIIKGVVRLERFEQSGDFGFFTYVKNNLAFPYRGLFSDANYPYLARAMTDVEIIYFPMALFEKILKQNIGMILHALKEAATIISATENQIQRMVTSSAHDRIIQAITILAEQLGTDFTAKKILIPYPVTIKEIALVSGTTRETASQVLKELTQEKKIIFERHQLVLLDDWFKNQAFEREERIFLL